MNRYQVLTTTISSTTSKLALAICPPRVNSSGTAATKANDEVLSIEMVSLPVGGMMTRIACGRTMRRITKSRVMPSAWAASDDFSHVGRLVETETEDRGNERRDQRIGTRPSQVERRAGDPQCDVRKH